MIPPFVLCVFPVLLTFPGHNCGSCPAAVAVLVRQNWKSSAFFPAWNGQWLHYFLFEFLTCLLFQEARRLCKISDLLPGSVWSGSVSLQVLPGVCRVCSGCCYLVAVKIFLLLFLNFWLYCKPFDLQSQGFFNIFLLKYLPNNLPCKYTSCTNKILIDKWKKSIYIVNMELTFAEQVKIILKRKKMTIADLAQVLGVSRQNVNQLLLRDNFKYSDMVKISAVLGCDLIVELREKP